MRIEVNGVRLFFDVEGAKLVPDGPAMREKPTLILLHGGPGLDHSLNKPWFSPLAAICQVVHLDYRGQGRSDRADASSWNLAQWADDVRALCDALEIERPVVLGTSFGGFVAMMYAIRHPDHPAKLILVSTQARFGPERSLQAFERLGGPRAHETARRFFGSTDPAALAEFVEVCLPLYDRRYQPSPDEDARVLKHLDVMLHFEGGEAAAFGLRSQLNNVRCPALVLVGDDDPIEPLEDSEEIVSCLPPGLVQFEHFPDAGHPVYGVESRAFDLIREFILS